MTTSDDTGAADARTGSTSAAARTRSVMGPLVRRARPGGRRSLLASVRTAVHRLHPTENALQLFRLVRSRRSSTWRGRQQPGSRSQRTRSAAPRSRCRGAVRLAWWLAPRRVPHLAVTRLRSEGKRLSRRERSTQRGQDLKPDNPAAPRGRNERHPAWGTQLGEAGSPGFSRVG
jgi:hypothetical protein